MGRLWRIQRAAVEQEILFPTENIFQDYIKNLEKKEYQTYEIVEKTVQEDGSLIVLMRKSYNVNEFLPAK